MSVVMIVGANVIRQAHNFRVISHVHTAGCKSTYHWWQVQLGGAPVVGAGENTAGSNLPPTKLDLPPTIYLW